MKSKEQVEKMLDESLNDLPKILTWYDKALKTYQDNRKNFGEADFGEVDAASQQLSTRKAEIETLKWVLL
jgi:hypothetical protein